MIWVRIHGSPLRQFYADPRARPSMDQEFPQHDILISAGNLASTTTDEGPNFTVTLKNTSGESSRLFSLPPPGAFLEVLDDATVIGAGTVRSVELGDPCAIVVQG